MKYQLKELQGYTYMIKYHNDMNLVAFKEFSQRELNVFFALCLLMKEKGTGEIILTYNDIKSVIFDRFESNEVFKDILESVYDKLLQLRLEFRDEKKIEKFFLFTSYKIDMEKETVNIKTNTDYEYILNNLSSNFTLFELQEFNELSSTYSKHIFRLLKQYKSTGYYKVSIDELKRLLDIPETYDMRKISDKILSQINKELPKYFDNFRIEKIKEGRSIKYLEFHFKPQHYKANDDNVLAIEADAVTVHEGEDSKQTTNDHTNTIVHCPNCGGLLSQRTSKDGSVFWGHTNYKINDCKATFSSLEEINELNEKKKQQEELVKQEVEKKRLELEKKREEQEELDKYNLENSIERTWMIERVLGKLKRNEDLLKIKYHDNNMVKVIRKKMTAEMIERFKPWGVNPVETIVFNADALINLNNLIEEIKEGIDVDFGLDDSESES